MFLKKEKSVAEKGTFRYKTKTSFWITQSIFLIEFSCSRVQIQVILYSVQFWKFYHLKVNGNLKLFRGGWPRFYHREEEHVFISIVKGGSVGRNRWNVIRIWTRYYLCCAHTHRVLMSAKDPLWREILIVTTSMAAERWTYVGSSFRRNLDQHFSVYGLHDNKLS